ncbi:AraC family transcriptional regulator [Pedobacter foliorum]|uniref:helix-turn-helix domain-containing protein n=1 Tax=Pedobacter foliorum TaxID=2739058 RepID=UPI001567539E|nr:helix-turn-helix domain-containing protein [Pedobacter foliorum]NRF39562.1 AraC family transcriptional regulator [Pedobacter foliorum]
MEVLFFKPQSELLKKYIDYFYLINKNDLSENVSYYTFPQINSIVSINHNPRFIFEKNKVTVKRNRKLTVLSTLICNYSKPIEVSIPGYLNEITISFKPLGLNAFLDKDLNTYTDIYFSFFNPYIDFHPVMAEILSLNSSTEKIKQLEDYLITKHRKFNHPFLHEVLADMLNADCNYTIKDIAAKYKISRKTLYKHFEIHIGKSPAEMRKLIRFRQIIKEHIKFNEKFKLCDIAHKVDFFDHSHLIKDFKSITGLTPKTYFKKVSPLNDGLVSWLFI